MAPPARPVGSSGSRSRDGCVAPIGDATQHASATTEARAIGPDRDEIDTDLLLLLGSLAQLLASRLDFRGVVLV